jgi:predicted DCC family thiol-disulfide oxidoreductase YuxK
MVHLSKQDGPDAEGIHLVLYDGVCGLCSRLLRFTIKHDRRSVFRFASLQSAVGKAMVARSGGNPDDLNSFYVFANFRTPHSSVLTRSNAALFVAGELGWPWKALRVAGLLPAVLRDRAYNIIARFRYRLFGRYDHCEIPSPEVRSRFID